MNQLSHITEKVRQQFLADSMRRNSTLLILAQLVTAGSLFLFWIINARLFAANLVGLATAFVSFGVLAATFTNLGLPNTIIRFLPKSKRQGGLFSASLLLVLATSLLGGLVALFIAQRYVSDLGFIQQSNVLSLLLIALVMVTAVSALLDGTLVSFRRGEYVLTKSIIVSLPRLILPFFVVAIGVRGITWVYVTTLLAGIIYNLIIIVDRLLAKQSLSPTLVEVTKHKAYAASNYFGGMFGVLPITVVPLIVLSSLGAAPAAYFYMPMMIAALISLICNSISQALISECSQTDDIELQRGFFRQALKHQYRLLVPLIIALIILGWPLLRIYGPEYAAQGYVPLVILVISGLLVGLNWLGDTWLNIQKRSRAYFFMNAFNALAVVGFVWLFASHGLIAVALGWFCGQLVSAVVYLAIFSRGHLLNSFK